MSSNASNLPAIHHGAKKRTADLSLLCIAHRLLDSMDNDKIIYDTDFLTLKTRKKSFHLCTVKRTVGNDRYGLSLMETVTGANPYMSSANRIYKMQEYVKYVNCYQIQFITLSRIMLIVEIQFVTCQNVKPSPILALCKPVML